MGVNKMDYGKLLSRTWNIVWNNKFMFVLGFLAALGGSGGGSNFNYRLDSGSIPPNIEQNIERFLAQYGGLLIGLGCLALILAIVFWLVRLAAQAALIDAAPRLEAGEKMTLGAAFSSGTARLGRFIGLYLLLYGPFVLLGIVSLVAFAATAGAAVLAALASPEVNVEALIVTAGLAATCMGLLACLMTPFLLVVTLIYPFAQRGAVLKNLGVTASIGHGWQVVKNNIGEILLLGLLFIILGFVVSAIAAVVLLPVAFLAAGPALLNVMTGGAFGIAQAVSLLIGGLCLGFVGAAVNSVLVAFRSTAVTLAYQEFAGRLKMA
jgi:hypothetical protein